MYGEVMNLMSSESLLDIVKYCYFQGMKVDDLRQYLRDEFNILLSIESLERTFSAIKSP